MDDWFICFIPILIDCHLILLADFGVIRYYMFLRQQSLSILIDIIKFVHSILKLPFIFSKDAFGSSHETYQSEQYFIEFRLKNQTFFLFKNHDLDIIIMIIKALLLLAISTTVLSIEWYQEGNPSFLSPDNYTIILSQNKTLYKFVKFFTPYCRYCRYLKDVLHAIRSQKPIQNVIFYEFNCEQYVQFCIRMGINSWPHSILYGPQGNKLSQLSGFYPKPIIEKFFNENIPAIQAEDTVEKQRKKKQAIQQQLKKKQQQQQRASQEREKERRDKLEEEHKKSLAAQQQQKQQNTQENQQKEQKVAQVLPNKPQLQKTQNQKIQTVKKEVKAYIQNTQQKAKIEQKPQVKQQQKKQEPINKIYSEKGQKNEKDEKKSTKQESDIWKQNVLEQQKDLQNEKAQSSTQKTQKPKQQSQDKSSLKIILYLIAGIIGGIYLYNILSSKNSQQTASKVSKNKSDQEQRVSFKDNKKQELINSEITDDMIAEVPDQDL